MYNIDCYKAATVTVKFFKILCSFEFVMLVLCPRLSVLDFQTFRKQNFFLILARNYRKRPETPHLDRYDLRLVLYQGGQKQTFQKLLNLIF